MEYWESNDEMFERLYSIDAKEIGRSIFYEKSRDETIRQLTFTDQDKLELEHQVNISRITKLHCTTLFDAVYHADKHESFGANKTTIHQEGEYFVASFYHDAKSVEDQNWEMYVHARDHFLSLIKRFNAIGASLDTTSTENQLTETADTL